MFCDSFVHFIKTKNFFATLLSVSQDLIVSEKHFVSLTFVLETFC